VACNTLPFIIQHVPWHAGGIPGRLTSHEGPQHAIPTCPQPLLPPGACATTSGSAQLVPILVQDTVQQAFFDRSLKCQERVCMTREPYVFVSCWAHLVIPCNACTLCSGSLQGSAVQEHAPASGFRLAWLSAAASKVDHPWFQA
jgi:hypothetical protein